MIAIFCNFSFKIIEFKFLLKVNTNRIYKRFEFNLII
jgi:hypothetical protein